MAGIRRKIVIKKDNTRLVSKNQRFNTYEIKTLDKKTHKERIINLTIDRDLIKDIEANESLMEVCFYVKEDQLNMFYWEINPNSRIVVNSVIKRFYSDNPKQAPSNKALKAKKTTNTQSKETFKPTKSLIPREPKTSNNPIKHKQNYIQEDKQHNLSENAENNASNDIKQPSPKHKNSINNASENVSTTNNKQIALKQEILDKRLETLEKRFDDLLFLQKSNERGNSNAKLDELKEILLSFVSKQRTHTQTSDYLHQTQGTTTTTTNKITIIKSRRNWKSRGFERIQTYFNIKKLELINTQTFHGETARTYLFKTKVWKKLRTITLKTTEKFSSNANVNFYIKRELVDADSWNINDLDNQITFFTHKIETSDIF